MNAWIRWAASLYPAAWRRRYGVEFEALLQDVQPGWRDFFDILGGAIRMHFKIPVGGKIVAATAAAGLAIAVWFAVRTPDQYVSTAVMQCSSADAIRDQLVDAQRQVFSRSSLTEIVMREDLYKRERQVQPLEDIIQAMRYRDIAVRSVSRLGQADSFTFTLQFRYPDRKKAQAVTRDLTSLFSEKTAVGQGQGLQVLDPPSLPLDPVAPRRSRIVIMGTIGGLLSGLLLLGVRRWPLVAACGAAAAVLVYGGSLLIPNRYVSTAVLTMTDQDAARRLMGATLDDAYLRSLIERFNLYPGKRAKEPADRLVAEMRNHDIRVNSMRIPESGSAVIISYTSDASPYTAQTVANELARHAIEMNLRLRTQNTARVLDPPGLRKTPVAPNRTVLSLLGLVGGLLTGTTWAVMRCGRAVELA